MQVAVEAGPGEGLGRLVGRDGVLDDQRDHLVGVVGQEPADRDEGVDQRDRPERALVVAEVGAGTGRAARPEARTEAWIHVARGVVYAIQFAVIPQNRAIAFLAGGFWFLESAKFRGSFLPGRWLEC